MLSRRYLRFQRQRENQINVLAGRMLIRICMVLKIAVCEKIDEFVHLLPYCHESWCSFIKIHPSSLKSFGIWPILVADAWTASPATKKVRFYSYLGSFQGKIRLGQKEKFRVLAHQGLLSRYPRLEISWFLCSSTSWVALCGNPHFSKSKKKILWHNKHSFRKTESIEVLSTSPKEGLKWTDDLCLFENWEQPSWESTKELGQGMGLGTLTWPCDETIFLNL